MKKNKKKLFILTRKSRLYLSVIAITIVFFLLIIRLFYLMVIEHSTLSNKANEQWTNEIKIDARRGKILDRNNLDLAVSANVYRVDLDLKTLREDEANRKASIKDLSKKLADILNLKQDVVKQKLNAKLPSGQPANSTTLARRIEKEPANEIKALKVRGIIISQDTKRYYVNNNLLSHVLGFTDSDGQGLAGVELKYNKELSGIPGMRISEVDRQNDSLPYCESTFTPPINGKDITLTIDERLQNIADKYAEKALLDNKAKSTTIIMMDPKTGEVLALANKPDFNPNCPYEGYEKFDGKTKFDKLQQMWRNFAVSNAFESGSIFKVITSISALEEGVAGGNETYYCSGYKKYPNVGNPVHCWKHSGHGTQTFVKTLENSCNVAFMDIGAKLGKEKLNKHLKELGLGKLTGIDLPGETKGILKPCAEMSDMDLGTIAFGQTDTLNIMQYMAAFNAVANNGTWIQPHVMKNISHINDKGDRIIDQAFTPKTKNVASEEKTKQLRGCLRKVVSEGSAKCANVPGLDVGGKTGTAEKVSNGTYGEKKIATFAAMAPSDNPKLTLLVLINEPSAGEYFGGLIATPIAKPVLEEAFNSLSLK